MIGLTDKQTQLLTFLCAREAVGELCPSYEEMREHLGLASKSGVHRLVSALEERGYIGRLRYRARVIRVLDKPVSLNAINTPLSSTGTNALIIELESRGYAVRPSFIPAGNSHAPASVGRVA